MIQTILFDLGGVLLNLDKDACIQSFIDLGYTEAPNMITPYRQEGWFRMLESGLITPEDFCEAIRTAVGKPVDNETIKTAVRNFLLDIPMEKLDYVAQLKKRYRVVMLSNTSAIAIEYITRRNFTARGLRLEDYFDECYYSFDLKCMKPDSEIFQRMIDLSGMVPQETLFVDDSRSNLEASEKFGFQTFFAPEYSDWRNDMEARLQQLDAKS